MATKKAIKKKKITKKKTKKVEEKTIKVAKTKENEIKEIIQATFARERILTESTDTARNLYGKSVFGQIIEDGRVQLSLLEALYLLEKKKIIIKDGRKKSITSDEFIKKARKVNPKIEIGICGEHGGEPESVKFCHRIGLNDVSCSPYRVPIARLAAAQAALEDKK